MNKFVTSRRIMYHRFLLSRPFYCPRILRMIRALCFAAVLATVAWTAGPVRTRVSVSITSTPANGTTYVAGEVITTRMNTLRSPATTSRTPG